MIENIKINGCSATPTIMNIVINRKFKEQRSKNPKYDSFLIEIKNHLINMEDEYSKRIINVIDYKGKFTDICFHIVPRINEIYNMGYSPEECKTIIISEMR